jgi:hypothetical protein
VIDRSEESASHSCHFTTLKKGSEKNFVPIQIDTLTGQMVDSSYFMDSVVTAMFITPTDLLTAAVIASNHSCQLYEHRY